MSMTPAAGIEHGALAIGDGAGAATEPPPMADKITAYRNARRVYRAAWVTYQNAHGIDFLPALDAWIAADREVKRIEATL